MRFVLLIVGATTLAAAQAVPPRPVGWLLVLDKPYEGVREYDQNQTRPDGARVVSHQTQRFWRDSAGKVREEITRDKEKIFWTYVTDPAAKVQYRWPSVGKVAYVVKLGEPIPAREPTHPLQPGEQRAISSTVNGQRMKGTATLLEPKTINGQPTVGSHAVLYSDPEKTTQFSSEQHWALVDYHVLLEQEIDDQQYGHRVFVWKSFKPGEPKADLFQVPKGLTLKPLEGPDTEQFE